MKAEILKAVEALREIKNCLNCAHMDIEGNKCTKFNSQPPMHIIVKACAHHEPELPF